MTSITPIEPLIPTFGPNSISVDRSGKVVAGLDAGVVVLCDPLSRRCREIFGRRGQDPLVNTVACHPRIRGLVLMGAFDGSVRLLDIEADRLLANHETPINSVAWNSTGNELAVADYAGYLTIYTVRRSGDASREACFSLGPDPIKSVAWIDDSSVVYGSTNHEVGTFDLLAPSSGHRVISSHAALVNQVSLSTLYGQTYVASASRDKTTRVFDLEGELHAILHGHTESVKTVAWCPGGSLVATGGYDFRVMVHSLIESRSVTVGFHKNAVSAVAWAGAILVSAGWDNRIVWWGGIGDKSASNQLSAGLLPVTLDLNDPDIWTR